MVTFGEKLKALRINQKLTQRQLADRLNISKSVVSYYEAGEKFPSYDVLLKISEMFRVTTDYLLGVDRKRMIDVSDLLDEDVLLLISIANRLKKQ